MPINVPFFSSWRAHAKLFKDTASADAWQPPHPTEVTLSVPRLEIRTPLRPTHLIRQSFDVVRQPSKSRRPTRGLRARLTPSPSPSRAHMQLSTDASAASAAGTDLQQRSPTFIVRRVASTNDIRSHAAEPTAPSTMDEDGATRGSDVATAAKAPGGPKNVQFSPPSLTLASSGPCSKSQRPSLRIMTRADTSPEAFRQDLAAAHSSILGHRPSQTATAFAMHTASTEHLRSESRLEIMSEESRHSSFLQSRSPSEDNLTKWKRQGFIETLAPAVPPRRYTLRDPRVWGGSGSLPSPRGLQQRSEPQTESPINASTLQKGLLSSEADDDEGGSVHSVSSCTSSDIDYHEHTIMTATRCVIGRAAPTVLTNFGDVLAFARAQQHTVRQHGPTSPHSRPVDNRSLAQSSQPTSSTSDFARLLPSESHKPQPSSASVEGTSHTERARRAVAERKARREAVPFMALKARVEALESQLEYETEHVELQPVPHDSPDAAGLLDSPMSMAAPFSGSDTPATSASISPGPSSPIRQSARTTLGILRRETSSSQINALGLTFCPKQTSQSDIPSSVISKSRHLRAAISSDALHPKPSPAARPRRLHRASGNTLSSQWGMDTSVIPSSSSPVLDGGFTVASTPSRSETSLPLSTETGATAAHKLRTLPTLGKKPSATMLAQQNVARKPQPLVPFPTAFSDNALLGSQGSASRGRGASVSSQASDDKAGDLISPADGPYPRGRNLRREADTDYIGKLKTSSSFTQFRELFEEQLAVELCSSNLMSPSTLNADGVRTADESPLPVKSKGKAVGGATDGAVGGASRSDAWSTGYGVGRSEGREFQPQSAQGIIKAKDIDQKKARPQTPDTSTATVSNPPSPASPASAKSRWWKKGTKRSSQLGKSFPGIKSLGGSPQIGEQPLVISSPLTPSETPTTPTRVNFPSVESMQMRRSPMMVHDAELARNRRTLAFSEAQMHMSQSASEPRVGRAHSHSQHQQQRGVSASRDASGGSQQSTGAGTGQRTSFTGHRLPYWPSFGSRKNDSGSQQPDGGNTTTTTGNSKAGKGGRA